MLLHSGSGLHGHEYSAPTSPAPPISARTALVRSAFSSSASRASSLGYDTSILRPIRPSADIRRNTGSVSFVEQPEVKEEQYTEIMSDDGKSVTSREGSETASSAGRKRKKIPRPTTSYALALPAPTLLQKQQIVHVRPQLLIQLQRISATTRPIPMLDVLPSRVLVPRLAKKFPVMFKGRGGLGPNDILCVKSENYGTSPDPDSTGSDSDEECWASREVEAVICQTKRADAKAAGQAEIVFSSGSKWTAVPLSSSIYEISSIDEHGLKTTVRWVRRSQRSASDIRNTAPSTPSKADTKFNFSILDPNSRRHPIIASMTPSSLDIPDTYTIPLPTVAAKSPTSESAADSESIQEKPVERSVQTVSESLRKLIRITGVWVALRQGWSPRWKYDDYSPSSTSKTPASHNTQTPTSNTSSHCRGRSVSLDYKPRHNSEFATNGAETPESTQGSFSSVGGFSGKIKRLSGHRNSLMGADGGNDVFCGSVARLGGKPQRSVSAGTAFMAKVAARRPPSTVASDSDGESLNINHNHSPPRRAVTTTHARSTSLSAGVGGSSNLSILDDDDESSGVGSSGDVVGKAKRRSMPSPLGIHVEPIPDENENENEKAIPVRPFSMQPMTSSSLAAASASAALSGKSGGHGGLKGKSHSGRWGRFTGLFRKGRG